MDDPHPCGGAGLAARIIGEFPVERVFFFLLRTNGQKPRRLLNDQQGLVLKNDREPQAGPGLFAGGLFFSEEFDPVAG